MARSQRRRGSRGAKRSGRERSPARQLATEAGGVGASTPVAVSTTPRFHSQRRSWHPFGFLRRLQPRAVADVIAELRKVTWPTFAETRYLTFVVAVVAIVIGLILGMFDLLFGWIIEQLFFS